MSGRIDKILLIRLSSIGDIVLSSPLIRVLRAAFPSSRIDFLVKSEYADLVKYDGRLSAVILLKRGDKEELRLIKRNILKSRYDLIIDIHNSLRSRYLRWRSGAKEVVVVRKRVVTRFFLVRFKWNFYRNIISVADRYLETVKKFGIENDGQGPEVSVPDEIKATAGAILEKFRLDRFGVVVGMAPSARHFTKRWLPERYVELAVRIAGDYRAKIFIFGSKEEYDYCGDIAQMINASLGSPVAESFAGKLTLLETAAVFDACNLVVTNDTGLMHLAGARKRKTVAIFGSTVREFGFIPSFTENIVVERRGLPCRPCSHIGLDRCPEGHFRCMKDITVEDVFRAAQTVLAPGTS